MGRDRRRYPRVGVALSVAVQTGSRLWQGNTADLSPHGVKARLPGIAVTPPRGSSIQLRLALPKASPTAPRISA